MLGRFNRVLSTVRRSLSLSLDLQQSKLSTMVIAKKFVLLKHFVGEPKPTDMKIVEEELPALQDNEFLVEAEYLSVDPYMRVYALQYPLGITMIGEQVGKIIESKNSNYPVGKRVSGYFGWRSHTIYNPVAPAEKLLFDAKPYLLPEMGSLSPSLGLGVLGMPGYTAYFGFLEICQPKAGEVLVVSGAAGAVGSIVGQIGKIKGLTVIGICGSDAKCKWIKSECGFDHAINYKTQDIGAELKQVAPDGVDCYFDNVGGDISSSVIFKMKQFGRISVCGSISTYDADATNFPKTKVLQPAILMNQLKMEGFLVYRWADRYEEGFKQNLRWVEEGKLKYQETVTHGFENMFTAFTGMLKGANTGKALVKV